MAKVMEPEADEACLLAGLAPGALAERLHFSIKNDGRPIDASLHESRHGPEDPRIPRVGAMRDVRWFQVLEHSTGRLGAPL